MKPHITKPTAYHQHSHRHWPAQVLARRWPRRAIFVLIAALLGLIFNTASLAELTHTLNAIYHAGATSWNNPRTKQFPNALGLFTYGYPSSYFGDVTRYVTLQGVSDIHYTFGWNNIQPKPHDPSVFNWQNTDTNLNALPANDTIFGTLGPFPVSWDQTVPCGVGAQCTGITDDLGTLLTSYTETDPANPRIPFNAWDMYVFQTVSRYGPSANGLGAAFGQNRVHAWEILSEIDNSVFGDRGVNFSPSREAQQGHDYGEVLKRAAYIIHLADPSALIISQGLSDYDPNQLLLNRAQLLPRSQTFVRAMATTGALAVIDGFGIHPYGAVPFDNGTELTRFLDSAGRFVEQLAGRRIPLWVTEVGFTSDAIAPGALCEPICETHADTPQRPSGSKVMFQTLVELMASPYVRAIYWFQASTFYTSYAGTNHTTEANYGLMTEHSGNPTLIQSDGAREFFAFVSTIFNQDYRVMRYSATSSDALFTFENATSYLTVIWSPGIFPLNTSKIAPAAFAALSFWHYKGFQIFPGHAPIGLGDQPMYVISSVPLILSGHDLLLDVPTAPTATPTYAVPGAHVPMPSAFAAIASDPRKPLGRA